jgi:iron(II)-dependent oxidoreductase
MDDTQTMTNTWPGRDALLAELHNTRQRTRELITSLPEPALDVPYHPGVNPPLWEMGHAAFFYEVFLFSLLDSVPSIDPAMDDLWDSFHVRHKDRWSRDLFPGRQETLDYFDLVYERVAERIRNKELTDEARYLYRYGMFHQNMHIESLIWCRQTVGYPAPPGVANDRPAPGSALAGDAVIPAGRWLIGMPGNSDAYATDDFAFDNEKPQFEIDLDSFAIGRQAVSNREFLAFVEEGGYQRTEFWSFGGRNWLDTEVVEALTDGEPAVSKYPECPVYWRLYEGSWQERWFDQWQPLNPDAPVAHISYWEAEAYCNWAGRRLPTEFEWEVAALGNRPDKPFNRFPWGNTLPDAEQADLDGRNMGRNPVYDYPAGDSPFGCRQMLGSVWEWTSNQYLPYDGFKVDMYPFMSTLQFGDHKTTRGGSCATSSCLIRGTYRQAYLPERTDVYTGFRTCAR